MFKLFNVNICVYIAGNPAEHSISTKFTEKAKKNIPIIDINKFFVFKISFILFSLLFNYLFLFSKIIFISFSFGNSPFNLKNSFSYESKKIKIGKFLYFLF